MVTEPGARPSGLHARAARGGSGHHRSRGAEDRRGRPSRRAASSPRPAWREVRRNGHGRRHDPRPRAHARGARGPAQRGGSVRQARARPRPTATSSRRCASRSSARGRFSACVSSQAGCALACAFCATGRLGLSRNLEVWEIVEQVRLLRATLGPGERIHGVVFQGMGEPLANVDRVIAAIRVMNDPCALAIDSRAITVCTSGLPSGIRQLAREVPKVRLGLSIGSARPAVRRRLMPIDAAHSLEDVLAAAEEHARATGLAPMWAVTPLAGVNDTDDDASRPRGRGPPLRGAHRRAAAPQRRAVQRDRQRPSAIRSSAATSTRFMERLGALRRPSPPALQRRRRRRRSMRPARRPSSSADAVRFGPTGDRLDRTALRPGCGSRRPRITARSAAGRRGPRSPRWRCRGRRRGSGEREELHRRDQADDRVRRARRARIDADLGRGDGAARVDLRHHAGRALDGTALARLVRDARVEPVGEAVDRRARRRSSRSRAPRRARRPRAVGARRTRNPARPAPVRGLSATHVVATQGRRRAPRPHAATRRARRAVATPPRGASRADAGRAEHRARHLPSTCRAITIRCTCAVPS